MAGEKSTDLYKKRHSLDGCPPDGDRSIHTDSACASDRENALALGIKVDHHMSVEEFRIQRCCAQKADLLVYREQALKRRVRDLLIIQERKHIRHCDSVISPERRSIREEIISFRFKGNGII